MVCFNTPNLKTVNDGTLFSGNAQSILGIEFPSLEYVTTPSLGNNANLIDGLSAIESLEFPALKTIIDARFIGDCRNLKTVDLPNLETVESKVNVMTTNNAITRVTAPKLTTCKSTVGGQFFLISNALEYLKLGSRVDVWQAARSANVDGLHIDVEESYTSGPAYNTNNYGDYHAPKLYFDTLKKGNIRMGGSGSYSNACTYVYLGCYGNPDDEIALFYHSTCAVTDLEIRDGAKQKLTLTNFTTLTADNIVAHIFEKLADNTYQEDGVTPAEPITITLGTANLNKLTAEQKAVATDKNYILA